VALQGRDYELLGFLSEQKFGTREQVARKFFPGQGQGDTERVRPDQVAYRRLLILGQFAILEKRHVRTDSTQLYQPSRLGLGKLTEQGVDTLSYLSSIDIRTYEHDRRVTDVRIALEWFGGRDWQSERRLFASGWKGHRPDATFRLGENFCGLEMELARKREDRYPQIFKSIRRDHRELNAVFYLCGNRIILDAVLGQARKADDARRYYFATWEGWLAKETNIEFEGVRERIRWAEIR
jgi:hypothetical protein